MEPLAPGTEDDPPINLATLNKQESEKERLLNIRAVLADGRYGNVFELNYVNGAEHWFCHACKCPVMGRVYQHEMGRRHTISISYLSSKNKGNQPPGNEPDEINSIQVAPGEPLPPGFEGEVPKVSQIQERLDGFNVGPLVALEYLLELQDYDPSKEPWYLCILCDKRGDPRTVLTHLASYNHISQYLQKHFPTSYRALAPYMTKQYKRNWQTVLQKIAEAIEKKFGRMKPMPVDKDKFEKDRLHYLQMIAKGHHFSEQMGHTFEELVVHEELIKQYDENNEYELSSNVGANFSSSTRPAIKKRSPSPPVVARPTRKGPGNSSSLSSRPTRRRSLSSVSSISSSDLSDYDERKHRHERGSSYRRRSPITRRRSPIAGTRRRSPFRRRSRSPPPRRRSRSSSHSKQISTKERLEKVEEFKRLIKAIESDMENVLKQHEKNPEKHPQYNEEWKKFWNRRYKELQAQGVDVAKHDFKPEWIQFWNKRMVELHNEEVKSRKEALRKRLGLPEEPAPISFRISGKKSKSPPQVGAKSNSDNKKPLPMAAQPDQDNDVIVIDDKEDEISKSSKRAHSPWEKDSPPTRSKFSRDRRSRSRSRSVNRYKSHSGEKISSTRKLSPIPAASLRRSRSREDSRSHRRSRSRSREGWVKYVRESSYERDLRNKERVRTITDLPWEREKALRKAELEEYYKPPPVLRDVTRKPVIHASVPPVSTSATEEDDTEVNVVSVLRLLTALEERLGSLGPKVIDLLAKALAMEKKEANSSECLLDNEINCVLFETVKEKLKGQLLAGFVDAIQERAFKTAIRKTASLVHLAEERKKEKETVLAKMEPVKVKSEGTGCVDKASIARQIASALVMQGKTDVTQTELEQLINTVVNMQEAAKNSKQPINTASFLDQLSSSGSGTSGSATKVAEIRKTSSPVQLHKKDDNFEPLTPSPDKINPNNMDHLSDSDLQALLQNFKDLSTEEQHGLINYLKKLEANEPERVERLRKFVNLGGSSGSGNILHKNDDNKYEEKVSKNKESPFSNRTTSANPTADDLQKIDSDEEDYNFEDVVKEVSKNVKAKELEKERKIIEENMKVDRQIDLSEAKNLISNVMANINKNTNSDLTKAINNLPLNINMDNLASIVGSVNKLQQQQQRVDANSLQGIMGPDFRLADQSQLRTSTNIPGTNFSNNFQISQNRFSGATNSNFTPNNAFNFQLQNQGQIRPNVWQRDQFNIQPPSQMSANTMGSNFNSMFFQQQPQAQQQNSNFMTGSNMDPNRFSGNNSRYAPVQYPTRSGNNSNNFNR